MPAGSPTCSARSAIVPALAAALLLAAPPVRGETALTTIRVASGLARPLFVTAPPGDTSRVFIVDARGPDARGRIRILKNGSLLPTPFLTTAPLSAGFEQGLLGLAFAPDYAVTGRFYIAYTNATGTSILARHTVSAFPDTAHAAGEVLLSIAQPYANHNGGWIGFGPDGYLYYALGDGGDANDPGDRAQNLNALHGKILRLDVSGSGVAIPPDNPFAGATPGLDEIWAYGLRNPWRCSFDRLTGDFIIADVGQARFEEINFQPAGMGAGANYGWRCYEGDSLHLDSATIPCGSCPAMGCPKTFPVHTYDHTLGRCSITGGYVYRGCAIPDLRGEYFFADWCSNDIYSARLSAVGITGLRNRTSELAPGGGLSIGSISGFGEDARGEIYLCDLGGEVFKIVPAVPVLEADMPSLRARIATGDSLGSTTPGNALLPGITPFADAGSRIAGVGYLRDATLLECVTETPICLSARLELSPFEIDLEACVDTLAGSLTRRFVFRNTGAAPVALDYRDVVTPAIHGDADRGAALPPESPGDSPLLVQFDQSLPARYLRHAGTASGGAAITAEVDTASQIVARIAADQPLGGGTSAGPSLLGMALGFDFGAVAPAAAETVTVVTRVDASAPSGVESRPGLAVGRLRVLGSMPFGRDLPLAIELARGGEVTLDLFDAQGRRVRTLVKGRLPAGFHAARWDGRTSQGREVASGVYFLRLRTGGFTDVRRVVRLR